MRQKLEAELVNIMLPYIKETDFEDVKMKIAIVLGNYEISENETSLTVYQGDINEQMLKRFLIAKAARGLSARTIKYYRETITKTLQTIGKPYMDITPDDLRMYLAIRVQRDHVSKTTVNNERRNLSSFYTWLRNEELITKNPMCKVEAIKVSKKKKKAFSQMEIEELRHACRTARETAFVEVLISTWCRVSEVVKIKISDIDVNKIMVIGKGDKQREVYLSPKAQLAVLVYLNERSDNNPYLFPKAKYAGDLAGFKGTNLSEWYTQPELVGNGPMSHDSLEHIIANLGKRAGVQNTHPHRFRRTGATMALRAGMPLMTVSKMLGHESIATTQLYLDISDKELEQAHEHYVV